MAFNEGAQMNVTAAAECEKWFVVGLVDVRNIIEIDNGNELKDDALL